MGPVGDFLGFSRVRIHDSVKKNKPRGSFVQTRYGR